MSADSHNLFDFFSQYGVLGVVSFILGYTCWKLLKRQIVSEERLQKQVDELHKEMNNYIKNDQKEMVGVISENTTVLKEISSKISRL